MGDFFGTWNLGLVVGRGQIYRNLGNLGDCSIASYYRKMSSILVVGTNNATRPTWTNAFISSCRALEIPVPPARAAAFSSLAACCAVICWGTVSGTVGNGILLRHGGTV